MKAEGLKEFLDGGFCAATNPDTGEILALVDIKYRFRLQQITEVLLGSKAVARVSFGVIDPKKDK